jgi:hypothetical protein
VGLDKLSELRSQGSDFIAAHPQEAAGSSGGDGGRHD